MRFSALAIACTGAALPSQAASDTWSGTTDSTWATSTNWVGGSVPGTGEIATFNGAGNGNTTIDLGGGVTIGTVLFDTASAAAYTIGSGAVGSQTLTLNTAGAVTMNAAVANNQLFNAALTLSGTATFTNNSTTNSLTFAGNIATTSANAITVTGSGNTIISGAISGTGSPTFIKTGTGTVTLSGANTYSGGTRANAGTTIISGTRPQQTGNNDWVSVNNVGAQNATLKIVSGADWGIRDFNIGEAANSRAAVFQTGGTFTVENGVWLGNNNTNSYGYYNLSSGTLTNTGGDIAIGRGNGATGVMEVSGGTVTAGSWIVLGRGQGAGTAASGLLNVTGGSVTSNSNNIALNWAPGSGALSVLNVGGGVGTASVTGVSNAANYLDVSQVSATGTMGVVNVLSNGTLTVPQVRVSGANATALFNFNGGTLKPTAANAGVNFMNDADMDAVTVYSGGGTIDNNSTNITIGNVLGAATGNGVSSIAVTDGGSGYIGAPLVKITDGTGNSATGYAVMVDDGTGNGTFKVGSIVVTSPGTYSVDPTTVTLSGGGATTAATIGTITTGANTSGGMTFTGSGTTTLTGANTYTGTTTVSAGTLVAGNASALGAGSVNVNGGALQSSVANVNTGSMALSSGSLTINTAGVGNLTLSAGATFTMNGGTWNIDPAALDSIIGTLTGTFSVTGGTFAFSSAPAQGSYQVLTGFNTSGNTIGSVGFSGLNVGDSAYLLNSGGNLTLVVVPEPHEYALAFAGLLGVLIVLRRRRLVNA